MLTNQGISLGSLADWVTALAAIATALTTVALTLIVHRFSRRSATLEIERLATAASQEMNVLVVSDVAVADFFRRHYFPNFDVDFVQRLYYSFWVLNVLLDVWTARRANLVSKRYYKIRFSKGAARLLRRNPDCVGYIAAQSDQFDPEFMQEVMRWLPDYDPAKHWPPPAGS